jgi:hypothetical protein
MVEGEKNYCNKGGKSRYRPVEDTIFNTIDTWAKYCKYLVLVDAAFYN